MKPQRDWAADAAYVFHETRREEEDPEVEDWIRGLVQRLNADPDFLKMVRMRWKTMRQELRSDPEVRNCEEYHRNPHKLAYIFAWDECARAVILGLAVQKEAEGGSED